MTPGGVTPVGGLRIIESVFAERDGDPIVHRLSWRARLLTWPWRPWVATWIEIPRVPAIYHVCGTIVAHPAIVEEMRRWAK